jgi:hypothetical protein
MAQRRDMAAQFQRINQLVRGKAIKNINIFTHPWFLDNIAKDYRSVWYKSS